MDSRGRRIGEEGGQTLVLFALMFMALVMFLVLTIDVGMLLAKKGNAQNVADAAALAGAQELPEDPLNAEKVARDYVTQNGLDPSEFVFSFSCTSASVLSCDPSKGTFDTIKVETNQKAPALFGPILGLLGSDSCWTSGCSSTVKAAACRGSCGASGSELDVVLALDHTASMTATDMANAKSGARTFMQAFDYRVHKLGLAVTPPVDPLNHCDSINAWTDPKVWLPVPLTSAYQSAPQVLDNTSALVSNVDCLDVPERNVELSGPHTNLGDPLKAALRELQTNGRGTAKWAIVLESDGAANIMDTTAAALIGATGPCDYAAKVAQQVKSLGIELYTIAYGADDLCSRDKVGTYWYNKPATELLRAIATDPAHAYLEPKTGDLDAIFQAVGQQLASGSSLVE